MVSPHSLALRIEHSIAFSEFVVRPSESVRLEKLCKLKLPRWETGGRNADSLKHSTGTQLLDGSFRLEAVLFFDVVRLNAPDVVWSGAAQNRHQFTERVTELKVACAVRISRKTVT